MKPLVSIITPAYNVSRYLKSFFDSVLRQDYTNYELIFINDGSTDDTEMIALQYKKVFEQKGHRFVYLFKENGGQAAALNTGFPYMKGKYFIWPDSDDILCFNNLSVKVDFMEANPSVDLGIAWANHVKEFHRVMTTCFVIYLLAIMYSFVLVYIFYELLHLKNAIQNYRLMKVAQDKIINSCFL